MNQKKSFSIDEFFKRLFDKWVLKCPESQANSMSYRIALLNVNRLQGIAVFLLFGVFFSLITDAFNIAPSLLLPFHLIYTLIIVISLFTIIFIRFFVKKKDYPLKMLKWFYHLFWLINMLLVITVYLMDAYSSGKTASLFGFYLVLAAVPILSFWEIFLFLLLPNALMVGVWGFNILTLKEAIYTIFIYEALALVISQATYQTFLRMLDNEIKLHQSAKKLELMSLQDPLTGLNNRFGLTRAFNELKAGAKHNDLLFVIAIDIDFFKRFNDQHGHLVGDECLVHLANNIRTVFCDNNSAVGRIGGDEFIILYKTTFFKEVEWKMEMMYASLDELSQLLPLEETPISLSSGIAFAELKQLTTWTYLYEDADSLLYKIKNSGRNQFLFATKKEAE